MTSTHRCTTALAIAAMGMATAAEPVTVLDFRTGNQGWTGNRQVRSVNATPEGLAYECTGEEDPWLEGPPAERLPVGTPLRLVIRLKAEGGDPSGEVFYGPSFQAGQSAAFGIRNDGQWHDYEVPVAANNRWRGVITRLRLDPCNRAGVRIELDGIRLAR